MAEKQWQVVTGLRDGKVKKSYRRHKLVCVRQVIRLGTGLAFKEALQGLSFSVLVNTTCIERKNLMMHHGVAALARHKGATALQTPHLQAHLHSWQAYFHTVRPHGLL